MPSSVAPNILGFQGENGFETRALTSCSADGVEVGGKQDTV